MTSIGAVENFSDLTITGGANNVRRTIWSGEVDDDFASVISISYGIGEIYKIVTVTAIASDSFSFILNSSGTVILFAKKEGIFSAKEAKID